MIKEEVAAAVEASIAENLKKNPQSSAVPGKPDDENVTLVFGGFRDETFAKAQDWVNQKMRALNQPEPSLTYHKDDEHFEGIIYAKFSIPKEATNVVAAMEGQAEKLGGKTIWCKRDRPIEVRAPIGFLLGLRWQLNQWGFSKREVRVDDATMVMKVHRVPVLNAKVVDDALKLEWLSETWKSWEELQSSPELKKLRDIANDRLARSKASSGKGKGKGSQSQ